MLMCMCLRNARMYLCIHGYVDSAIFNMMIHFDSAVTRYTYFVLIIYLLIK
jgi:hypothetical protein